MFNVIDKDNDKGYLLRRDSFRFRKERGTMTRADFKLLKWKSATIRNPKKVLCFYLKRESSEFFIIYISFMLLIFITETYNLRTKMWMMEFI